MNNDTLKRAMKKLRIIVEEPSFKWQTIDEHEAVTLLDYIDTLERQVEKTYEPQRPTRDDGGAQIA